MNTVNYYLAHAHAHVRTHTQLEKTEILFVNSIKLIFKTLFKILLIKHGEK